LAIAYTIGTEGFRHKIMDKNKDISKLESILEIDFELRKIQDLDPFGKDPF